MGDDNKLVFCVVRIFSYTYADGRTSISRKKKNDEILFWKAAMIEVWLIFMDTKKILAADSRLYADDLHVELKRFSENFM